MFSYAGLAPYTLVNLAWSILDVDAKLTEIHTDDIEVIRKRLQDHVTGVRPIDGEEWLKKELKREKRIFPSSRRSR